MEEGLGGGGGSISGTSQPTPFSSGLQTVKHILTLLGSRIKSVCVTFPQCPVKRHYICLFLYNLQQVHPQL